MWEAFGCLDIDISMSRNQRVNSARWIINTYIRTCVPLLCAACLLNDNIDHAYYYFFCVHIFQCFVQRTPTLTGTFVSLWAWTWKCASMSTTTRWGWSYAHVQTVIHRHLEIWGNTYTGTLPVWWTCLIGKGGDFKGASQFRSFKPHPPPSELKGLKLPLKLGDFCHLGIPSYVTIDTCLVHTPQGTAPTYYCYLHRSC